MLVLVVWESILVCEISGLEWISKNAGEKYSSYIWSETHGFDNLYLRKKVFGMDEVCRNAFAET